MSLHGSYAVDGDGADVLVIIRLYAEDSEYQMRTISPFDRSEGEKLKQLLRDALRAIMEDDEPMNYISSIRPN